MLSRDRSSVKWASIYSITWFNSFNNVSLLSWIHHNKANWPILDILIEKISYEYPIVSPKRVNHYTLMCGVHRNTVIKRNWKRIENIQTVSYKEMIFWLKIMEKSCYSFVKNIRNIIIYNNCKNIVVWKPINCKIRRFAAFCWLERALGFVIFSSCLCSTYCRPCALISFYIGESNESEGEDNDNVTLWTLFLNE